MFLIEINHSTFILFCELKWFYFYHLIAVTNLRLIVFLFVIALNSSFGQDSNIPLALKEYQKSMGNQSHVSNGTSFKKLPASEEEHPFFGSSEFAQGSILYQGETYKNIIIQYNLVTDQVISDDNPTKNEIQLIKEGIQSFVLLDHTFVQFINHPILSNGFYDQLHDGEIKVLVKREKSLQNKVVDNKSQAWYQSKTKVYITKADQVFIIRSRKSVLSALAGQREQIKKVLRQKKVRFTANREQYCKEAAMLYTSIKQ